jgi:hypothetical protein
VNEGREILAHGSALHYGNIHDASVAGDRLYFLLKYGIVTGEFLDKLSSTDEETAREIKEFADKSCGIGPNGAGGVACLGFRMKATEKLKQKEERDERDVSFYVDLNRVHRFLPIGADYPEQMFNQVHILINPDYPQIHEMRLRHGDFYQTDQRVSSKDFIGIVIPDLKFSPFIKPYPKPVQEDHILKQHAEEYYNRTVDKYFDKLTPLAAFHRRGRELGYYCLESHEKEIKREDHDLLVRQTIDFFAAMQEKVFGEMAERYLPLYSNNGDLLWPIQVPHSLLENYLSSEV